MKRILYTILPICLAIFSFAQKPQSGDFVSEIALNLDNVSANIPLQSLDTGNLLIPKLRGRYFLSDNLALRADLSLIRSSANSTFTNPLNDAEQGTYVQSQLGWGLGVGIEKHFGGNSRFSPFVGGGLSYTKLNFKQEGDDATLLGFSPNLETSSSVDFNTFGVNAFLGADYWITSALYVGTDFGLSFGSTTSPESESTMNGITAKSTEYKESQYATMATPSIRLGWNWNAREKGPKDADNDGVPDAVDKCPNTPEGEAVTTDGCPKFADEIRLLAKNIYFETASDKIKAESFEALDKVAAILIAHPSANLSIEGHTDSQGDDAMNLALSKKRALSVLNYLTSKGADVSHLSAEGYGETKPVADNATKEGRAMNRRVELIVTY